MKRRLMLAGLALAGAAWALPGDSVYQLDATLTDQRGQAANAASESNASRRRRLGKFFMMVFLLQA